MWSLFGKVMSYDFPERFSKFLTRNQYSEILKIITQHFKTKHVKHEYLGDGIFRFKDKKNWKGQLAVDNLIRAVIKKDQVEWKNSIASFLDSYNVDEDSLKMIYENFEYARPLLRVLIKPDSFDLSRPDSKQVVRIDFPETYSMLTLEFDGRFLFLTEDNIKQWNKSVSDLFGIAIQNTSYDEIKIIQIKMEFEVAEDYLMVYHFSSGDYSAAAMLDLVNGFDKGIGKYGSLVAIPSKGKAYCHPIEGDNILRLIYPVTKMAKAQFEEDPGHINLNFYWIYNSRIEKISSKSDSESGYKMPDQLLDLLRPN